MDGLNHDSTYSALQVGNGVPIMFGLLTIKAESRLCAPVDPIASLHATLSRQDENEESTGSASNTCEQQESKKCHTVD